MLDDVCELLDPATAVDLRNGTDRVRRYRSLLFLGASSETARRTEAGEGPAGCEAQSGETPAYSPGRCSSRMARNSLVALQAGHSSVAASRAPMWYMNVRSSSAPDRSQSGFTSSDTAW